MMITWRESSPTLFIARDERGNRLTVRREAIATPLYYRWYWTVSVSMDALPGIQEVTGWAGSNPEAQMIAEDALNLLGGWPRPRTNTPPIGHIR